MDNFQVTRNKVMVFTNGPMGVFMKVTGTKANSMVWEHIRAIKKPRHQRKASGKVENVSGGLKMKKLLQLKKTKILRLSLSTLLILGVLT
jgi:hypothetical protein